MLAVKIDNVAAARPQTGLGMADMVYVEPVEGGLTRLLAVYSGAPPAVIGPVRSARRTDLELLAQYGRPTLAYSGAAPTLLPALRAAELVNASPSEAPGAYYRDRHRSAQPVPATASRWRARPGHAGAGVRHRAHWRYADSGVPGRVSRGEVHLHLVAGQRPVAGVHGWHAVPVHRIGPRQRHHRDRATGPGQHH